MEEEEFSTFVDALVQSTDPEHANKVNEYVMDLISKDAPKILEMSLEVILADDIPLHAVQYCFAIIRNLFCPTFTNPLIEIKNVWKSIPDEVKSKIKTALMRGLFFPMFAIRSFAAYDWALIMQLSPRAEMCDSIAGITEPLRDPSFDDQLVCRMGCIQALNELKLCGFIDENTDLEDSVIPAVEFLTSFISDISPSDENEINDLVEMLSMFNNLFDIFGTVFEEFDNREHLIEILHGKMEIADGRVHSAIYDLFYTCCVHFYADMLDDGNNMMENIFTISVESFSADDQSLIEPAIEFWHKFAKYEKRVRDLPMSFPEGKDLEYIEIVGRSVESLTQMLIELMKNPVETEPSIEDFNNVDIPVLAAKCLRSISKLVPETTFPMVMESCDEALRSQNWMEQYGAMCALCSVVKVTDEKARQDLCELFPEIFCFAKHDVDMVAHQTLVFIEEMLRVISDLSYDPDIMDPLLSTICEIETENDAVRARIMCVIKRYAIASGLDPENTTLMNYAESPIYDNLMTFLSDRLEEAEESSSMYICYVFDAMIDVIQNVKLEAHEEEKLIQLLRFFVEKINCMGEMSQTVEDKSIMYRNIDVYCSLTHALFDKLGDATAHTDIGMIFDILSMCIHLQDVAIFNSALSAIVSLLRNCPGQADSLLESTMEYIHMGFISESSDIIAVTASCVFYLMKDYGHRIHSYEEELIPVLCNCVTDPDLASDTKVQVIYALAKTIKNLDPASDVVLSRVIADLNALVKLTVKQQKENDTEVAPKVYASLLRAYQAILRKSNEAGFGDEFCKNYRVVAYIFKAIAKYKQLLTSGLVRQIAKFWNAVLSTKLTADTTYGRRLNTFFNEKSASRTIIDTVQRIFKNSPEVIDQFGKIQRKIAIIS